MTPSVTTAAAQCHTQMVRRVHKVHRLYLIQANIVWKLSKSMAKSCQVELISLTLSHLLVHIYSRNFNIRLCVRRVCGVQCAYILLCCEETTFFMFMNLIVVLCYDFPIVSVVLCLVSFSTSDYDDYTESSTEQTSDLSKGFTDLSSSGLNFLDLSLFNLKSNCHCGQLS